MSTAIKVEGLSKRFLLGETFENTLSSRIGGLFRGRNLFRRTQREEFWALRDVSFEIAEGEAVGIVGGNGAGKSTLLKVLSRITPPTEGRARVKGRLSSLLEVGTGFHPELTGRENIFLNGAILGMRKAEVERKFDEIVAFAGVEKFIDTPVKRYSSGMYVRLAFAVAAHLEPDVLIIDEVLAVGDAEFQKRCIGKMGDVAKEGRTVIFVSHNMAAVQKLCPKAIWLRDGRMVDSGRSGEIVQRYLSELSGGSAAGQGSTGVLYEEIHAEAPPSSSVERLEMRDSAGRLKSTLATWDAVHFRIRYRIAERYRSFSVVLQVSTIDGVPLLLTSTAPDHGQAMSVEAGTYEIECEFERFPLAAGEYVVSVGLAIPGVEYIWRREGLSSLQVQPSDIYRSGLPPASSRYLVASEHQWRTRAIAAGADQRSDRGGADAAL